MPVQHDLRIAVGQIIFKNLSVGYWFWRHLIFPNVEDLLTTVLSNKPIAFFCHMKNPKNLTSREFHVIRKLTNERTIERTLTLMCVNYDNIYLLDQKTCILDGSPSIHVLESSIDYAILFVL